MTEVLYRTLLKMDQIRHPGQLCIVSGDPQDFPVDIIALDIGFHLQIFAVPGFL